MIAANVFLCFFYSVKPVSKNNFVYSFYQDLAESAPAVIVLKQFKTILLYDFVLVFSTILLSSILHICQQKFCMVTISSLQQYLSDRFIEKSRTFLYVLIDILCNGFYFFNEPLFCLNSWHLIDNGRR